MFDDIDIANADGYANTYNDSDSTLVHGGVSLGATNYYQGGWNALIGVWTS